MMLFRLMDTEMVINEVRSRECLWNPRNVYYKNKNDKCKAWEEVSEVVVPKYKTCSEDDKRRIVRAVQSRWKTARDAYMKCRYTEVKKPRYKSRQHTYIYKDKLTFLEQIKDFDKYEDDEGSNSVAENSASQSTNGVSDEDAGEVSDEIMDMGIDIHDDFKDKIKDLITEESINNDIDLTIDDVNQQEGLLGTSSQINVGQDCLTTADMAHQPRKRPRNTRPKKTKSKMSEFEMRLLKVLRLKNRTNSSALEADDQFFFDSLAPMLKNFDIHQKLKLRSKILELIIEVGNIRPVTVKQEKET